MLRRPYSPMPLAVATAAALTLTAPAFAADPPASNFGDSPGGESEESTTDSDPLADETPLDAVPNEPSSDLGRDWDKPADAMEPAEWAGGSGGWVPGAESTEPVLRCVYRPHPTRVRAIYEFLNAHAAAGVDVAIRPVDLKTGEAVRDVKYVRTRVPTVVSDHGGRRRTIVREVSQAVASDGRNLREELIVVALPETQRAIGQFLKLCLSEEAAPATPAPSTLRPSPDQGFEELADPEPEDFGSSPPGRSPFTSPERAGFHATPTGGPDDFPPAIEDDLGESVGDLSATGAPTDDVLPEWDEFGDDPAERTTRRPVTEE